MSALFSETLSDAFKQVRLSYDRILDRLSRCAMSVMNLAVRLLQLFCVTLLYFSAVKVRVFILFIYSVCALTVCTLLLSCVWDRTSHAFDKDVLVTEVIDHALFYTYPNV